MSPPHGGESGGFSRNNIPDKIHRINHGKGSESIVNIDSPFWKCKETISAPVPERSGKTDIPDA